MSGPTSAPASGDSHDSPALGYAIGIGFLVLVLANGQMPGNTQLALVCGVAAYIFFKLKAH